MCTHRRGEVSVNEAFELLKQNSENVLTDNLLNLQRDMVKLNSLLQAAQRSVKEVILSEINIISAKITSLIELEEGNMDSERKLTG
jgi:hypothetical protein